MRALTIPSTMPARVIIRIPSPEASAFVVMDHFGLENYSFHYVAVWAEGTDRLQTIFFWEL